MAEIVEVRRRALQALRPPPRLKLAEWIEREMRLPEGVSALPGRVRLWAPQRGIAEAIGDPSIERVTLVKPVRVGFTTLLTGALASYVANEPSPILALLPTEADARDYVVSDLEPIFEATPALRGLLSAEADELGRNTLLNRRFAGGSLKVVAAKSPRNLRRHNVRILLIDEADAMEPGVEGSPITLAERRTLSFANRKIILGSTPTFEETSNVLRAYARSDQRIFEVPCPECGDFHEIAWGDIQWPDGEPQRAHFVCPACGSVVEERRKAEMIEAGRWRATAPEVQSHAGFRLNALVSTLANASWGKLAAEFVEAKKNPDTLQVFVNTILAQGWREDGDELDDQALARRAESFSLDDLPEAVLAITAGVDVQRDRLEITYLGWSRDGETFALGHKVVWGLPDDDATWVELDDVLKMRFAHPLGGLLGVDAAAVDSGDGETMGAVYRFCFPRAGRKVLAIKGATGTRPWIERSKGRIKGGGWLWIVGVDGIKAHLVGRAARGRSLRFSDSLPPVWFEQLASERVVVRYARGQPVRRFERVPGRRAEALDCAVYAVAARQVLNVNWDARTDDLRGQGKTVTVAPSIVRSRWMS